MKSISEIKREFEQAGELELPVLFAQYESDARNGVTALIVRYRKQLAKLSAERERLEKMRCYEHQYEQQGLVCGIDEAVIAPELQENILALYHIVLALHKHAKDFGFTM